MKINPDEGKVHHDLWFILNGRCTNRGSILQAQCKCEGSGDEGCKHIVAAMYDLEDLLNSQGKGSVTTVPKSGLKDREQVLQCTKLKIILVIKKGKKPSYKNRKHKHMFSQNIEKDVHAPEDIIHHIRST